jgi:hypothetical protein
MKKNIVFVIGAGASNEVHIPTGHELKGKISKLLDIRFDDFGYNLKSGDYKIVDALRLHLRLPDGRQGNINSYIDQARHIRDALPLEISIDNFIDKQRNNEKIELCGKLAIVRSVLEAEKRSLLYFEKENQRSTINFNAITETWYTHFFRLITENCTKDELQERFNSITLVIFNYDRCIEHFIYYALQNNYRIPENEAAELVSNINIYHPYGDVGPLPWINKNEAVEFGLDPEPYQLLKIASKIKTFTEGTDPGSSEISIIRKNMGLANKLIFMGFAFHELNMRLIFPGEFYDKRKVVKCFATTFNISDSDQLVIKEQIKDLYGGSTEVKMSNTKCGAFFNEFQRSLGF